ncbi:sulfatase-like hydrolase/transferase [Cyclobacterium roseum]|uniref:sulfatase-like hydrolase/transferase n=1 Tax=Cyclobacterium roseum TaxID=2666137 RepID=UPI0013915C84|nr:sulfatase-like hydrolase/transferase [Cyclobacterium roseum]
MKNVFSLALLYLCIAPLAVAYQHRGPGGEKPNFIFIYSDDQRYDALGANGNPVIITPELDLLARQGIQFTNANVVFALCSPSRAAFLTGRYGSSNGVLELGSDLKQGEKTVAQYLKEEGYLTGMSGKWHIGKKPSETGFDFSVFFTSNGDYYNRLIYDEGKAITPEIHCDQYCASRSVDFLKDAAANDKPFFLFHNTQLPHMNGDLIWDAKEKTKAQYRSENMPVAHSRLDDLADKPEYLQTVRNLTQARSYGYPNADSIKSHTRDYYAVITEMDHFLSELFESIETLGLRENTYIFFMSDNGWMLGEHGFTSKVLPYRPSTHVPFFVLGPELAPGVNQELVLNIDMAPTILELAGIDIPPSIHGRSLVPILRGERNDWREGFVYEGLGTYGGAKPNLAFITNRYRYIETYNDSLLNTINHIELYDQQKDPDEIDNLAKNDKFKPVIQNAQQKIRAHKLLNN